MSTRTRREIVADWLRTVKIVTFTTLTVILIAWLTLGTVAMTKVDKLEKEIEYYRQLEEEANNNDKRIVIVDQLTGEIIYADNAD